MPARTWEPFLVALAAPLVVWLLWRGQTLSVELLRSRLVKLVRNRSQAWIYAVVSWFGVLLHEASHASVLILSGHGISQFKVGMEQGHVLPARHGKGTLSFLFFLVAALAPLFIPPLLFLGVLIGVTDNDVSPWPAPGPWLSEATADAAWTTLKDILVTFPHELALQVANLDLATWQGVLLLAVALLAMPASRPSHIKGSRFHGKGDEGDVAVLRKRIRHNPLPFLLFIALLYAAYIAMVAYGTESTGKWYWYGAAAVWGVALCGIVLALLGAGWWSLTTLDGRIRFGLAWIPPAVAVVVQVLGRLRFTQDPLPLWAINGASLAAWLLAAVILAMALPRRGRF